MKPISFKWDNLGEKNNIRFAHRVPYTIKGLLKPGRVWLAGGALRGLFDGTPVRDYDLFFNGLTTKLDAQDRLEDIGAKLLTRTRKGWVHTYDLHGSRVQLISHKRYRSGLEVIQDFDLVPSMFATDGQTFDTTIEAIRSATTKRLTVHKVTNPMQVIIRIGKYTSQYGYHFGDKAAREFVKMLREPEDVDKGFHWDKYLDEVVMEEPRSGMQLLVEATAEQARQLDEDIINGIARQAEIDQAIERQWRVPRDQAVMMDQAQAIVNQINVQVENNGAVAAPQFRILRNGEGGYF